MKSSVYFLLLLAILALFVNLREKQFREIDRKVKESKMYQLTITPKGEISNCKRRIYAPTLLKFDGEPSRLSAVIEVVIGDKTLFYIRSRNSVRQEFHLTRKSDEVNSNKGDFLRVDFESSGVKYQDVLFHFVKENANESC